jgi:lipopolysaccharide biosynthesis glycosyltransferase
MRLIGMRSVSYFNAGVILFDWQKTLSSGLLQKAREALRSPIKLKNSDQCALNIAIDGAFLKLDSRWNARPIQLDTIPDVGIAHFVGPQKPWQRSVPYYFRRFRDFYRSALEDSPWAAKIERETALEFVVQKLKDLVIYVTRRQRIRRLERLYGPSRQSAPTVAQR